MQPRDEGLAVVVVNDSAEEWSGELIVRRLDDTGILLAKHAETVTLSARSTVTVALPAPISEATDAAAELLRVELTGVRSHWFFAEYRDTRLGRPELDTAVERRSGGYRLRVKARTLTRDLTLLVDKLDPEARVNDMLVTLLPGESVEFEIDTDADLDTAALTASDVLRSANQLLSL